MRYAALGYLYLAGTGRALPAGNVLQHLLLAGRSLAQYALVVLWPFTTLRPLHYSPLPLPLDSLPAWLALAVSGGIVLGLAWWVRREQTSGTLALAGIVALLPVLNILPLELGGGAFVAERFLVFPLALLALAFSRVAVRGGAPRPRLALLGLWVVACIATVQLTVPHWRSDQALWTWGIRRAPRSAMPYTNLALVAIDEADASRGLLLAQQALERDPVEGSALNHLGLALFHLGRYAESEAAFARAIEVEPENALYWNNLAGALREEGQLGEAERVLLDEALRLAPLSGAAHFSLGLVYLEADRPDLAVPALTRALDLLPPQEAGDVQCFLEQTRDPARWLRLGDLLLVHGEVEGALEAFAQAEQLGARAADGALGRSAALIALQALDQAEALLEAALLNAPEDARLYNNLGLIAQERGEVDEAREMFEQAATLAPEWDLPRQNLETLEP
jgi:tetratricopeptide (TPR) repeat protein